MEKLNPEQARTILEYLLPLINAEHQCTRAMIACVTEHQLTIPAGPGRTVSDLIWHLAMVSDTLLHAVCSGEAPAVPVKPEETRVAAVLEWDDRHFTPLFEKLSQLTDEELVRPLTLLGVTLPAVHFLHYYLSNVLQYRGQLLLLSQAGEVQAPEQVAEDELNSAELTAVVGGTTTYQINPVGGGTNSVTTTTNAGTSTTSMVTLPGTGTQIQMTVNYTNNLAVPPPQPAFYGLLSGLNVGSTGAGAGLGGAMSVGAFLGLFSVLFL